MDKRICSRCISDTSIPGISFDENGVCNYCKAHDRQEEKYPLGEKGQQKLNKLVKIIKLQGKNKKYDCVVGVSGGTDSSYCLYLAKKLGLRPLAVHFNNGWNSDVATENMKKVTAKLGVDFKNIECDFGEFRDLQISFLRASVPDAEIPTDIAYRTVLYQAAAEAGVKYVLVGHSFRVEGFSPKGWTHMDGKYIESVQSKFGRCELKTFPNLMLANMLYYVLVKGIKYTYLLPYFDYRKEEVKEFLQKEFSWTYYGGHHYESIYTRFVAAYLLPLKFKIDKRIIEYSAYIRSGQMERVEALEKMQKPIIFEDELLEQVIERLRLTKKEFKQIMAAEPKSFRDYNTYYSMIKSLKIPIRVACQLKLIPPVFYEKYFK